MSGLIIDMTLIDHCWVEIISKSPLPHNNLPLYILPNSIHVNRPVFSTYSATITMMAFYSDGKGKVYKCGVACHNTLCVQQQ